jgi:hypothetical protein
MRNTCTLKANLARLGPSLQTKTGINGARYWSIPFEIVLELGQTQLQARLRWKEGVSNQNHWFMTYLKLTPTKDQDLWRTCDDYPGLVVLEPPALEILTSVGCERIKKFLCYGIEPRTCNPNSFVSTWGLEETWLVGVGALRSLANRASSWINFKDYSSIKLRKLFQAWRENDVTFEWLYSLPSPSSRWLQ